MQSTSTSKLCTLEQCTSYLGGLEWPDHSRRQLPDVNWEGRDRSMHRGMAALKLETMTRTTCAIATNADNIPFANDDNDFMSLQPARLHSPSLDVIDGVVVVTCSPLSPPNQEPQFKCVLDQRWCNGCSRRQRWFQTQICNALESYENRVNNVTFHSLMLWMSSKSRFHSKRIKFEIFNFPTKWILLKKLPNFVHNTSKPTSWVWTP
jgi:hypothetical protein